MRSFILILSLATMLGACSKMKTRPETADKLKPILVLVNPPDDQHPTQPLPQDYVDPPLPGQTVKLDFHFIGPADMAEVTLSEGEIEPRPLTVPISGWAIQEPDSKPFSGLSHVVIRATLTLPSAEALAALWPPFASDGLVRIRYTLNASDGQRSIPIAGDFVVYHDTQVPGATSSLFGSSIDSPGEAEAVGNSKILLASTIVNSQNEDVKIGWFVSAGEIKNRRAASTEWTLPGSGSYTLILTVRGKESRNGDIQIRQVTLP